MILNWISTTQHGKLSKHDSHVLNTAQGPYETRLFIITIRASYNTTSLNEKKLKQIYNYYFLLGLFSFFCDTSFSLLFLWAIRLVALFFLVDDFLFVNNFFPCLMSFCEVERNPWKLLLLTRLSKIKKEKYI